MVLRMNQTTGRQASASGSKPPRWMISGPSSRLATDQLLIQPLIRRLAPDLRRAHVPNDRLSVRPLEDLGPLALTFDANDELAVLALDLRRDVAVGAKQESLRGQVNYENRH